MSEVADESAGVAGSIASEVKFGGSAKRIKVHKSLVSATALTGGPYERERFDCVPSWGLKVFGHVPRPELDEVPVGVHHVGRARVLVGSERVLADVEARRP